MNNSKKTSGLTHSLWRNMSAVVTLNQLSYLLNIVVGTIIFVLGTVGTILIGSIFLTQQAFRQNTCIHYLLAGLVANLLLLVNVLLPRILTDGFALPLYTENEIFCRQRLYMSAAGSLCAIYFPCWAAFDQYASTSRAVSFRQRWSSVKFARQAIIVTILVSVVIPLPHLIFNGITRGICMGISRPFNQFNAYVYIPLFHGLIPVVTISFFTSSIIRNLRVRSNCNSSNHLARQLRRMLFPQLIIIVVSSVPFGIQAAYATITADTKKDAVQLAIEQLLFHIARLLFYCNYIGSFYIYILMSSEVRKSLRRLLVTIFVRRSRQIRAMPTVVQTIDVLP